MVFRVDAADAVAHRKLPENLAVVETADLARSRIKKEVVAGRGRLGSRAMDVPRRIEPQRQVYTPMTF